MSIGKGNKPMARGRTGRLSDAVLVIVMVGLCVALLFVPTGFEAQADKPSRRATARVLSVDNADLKQHQLVRVGSQGLRVRLEDGPDSGRELDVVNPVMGKMEMDEIYRPGERLLVEYIVREGKITRAVARGHYRLTSQWLLAGLFAVLLVGVAGWTGLKAILTFAFAALMLWRVMIPAFLRGYDPILVALGVVAALTAATSFLIGGVTRKGLATFLGAFLGLLLTCCLAWAFTHRLHIHGAVRPFAEALLYSGFDQLDLTRIFIAGVFLAASGAVMDLAMDISAAMDEIIQAQPEITMGRHILAGLRVGRSVIGTMTTTLLLAYSASYTAMLMLFMGQGIPPENVLNRGFVAAEVLNTLVGSFGLVTVAPFTALVAGLLHHVGRRPSS